MQGEPAPGRGEGRPEAARPPVTGRRARPPRGAVERTRAGALWTATVVGVLVLVAILIFVVQNGQKVQIRFLFMEGTLPLGVALLVATLLGALLMLSIGTIRIYQLRRAAKQQRAANPR